MTFAELCAADSNVQAVYEEALLTHNTRRYPDYCLGEWWYALPRESGLVGMKRVIQQNVPLEHQETVLAHVYEAAAPCRRPECHGPEGSCRGDYPVPPPRQEVLDGKMKRLTRERKKAGFFGLIDQLKHAGGVGPEPEPIKVVPINDADEPVYIVRSYGDAHKFLIDLKIRERFTAGELSRWYTRNWFYVCDDASREAVLALKKPEQVTGALLWKPVVITFSDPELENKLQSICSQVVTVVPNEKTGVLSLTTVKAAVKVIVSVEKLGIPDMPAEVLDGWLGQVCKERMGNFPIAFAWPALLSAASVLVPHSADKSNRTNLFVAIVAGKGTGKSSAFDYALRLLDIKSPPLLKLKAGSGEGLTKEIGDVGGESRLYFTDELAHILLKMQIQGSAFATIMNTLFYEDQQDLILAHNARVNFNCRLSMAGGVVDDMFADLFGASTTGGFHDRFLFGVGPTGYAYSYRSFSGEPALKPPTENDYAFGNGAERPVPVEIDNDVWDERDRIAAELKIPPSERRVLEVGLRCAVIAASLDGRRVLRAADLGPMKALVAYQLRVRRNLKPNPGKNPEAIVACKFMDYLEAHSPNGEWVNRRVMIDSTRASKDWGPSIVNRALQSLGLSGDVEQSKSGRQLLVRRVP